MKKKIIIFQKNLKHSPNQIQYHEETFYLKVSTIFVLNFHHRLGIRGQMPIAIRKIFLQWLPWVLRMAPNGVPLTKKSITLKNKVRFQDISFCFVHCLFM